MANYRDANLPVPSILLFLRKDATNIPNFPTALFLHNFFSQILDTMQHLRSPSPPIPELTTTILEMSIHFSEKKIKQTNYTIYFNAHLFSH